MHLIHPNPVWLPKTALARSSSLLPPSAHHGRVDANLDEHIQSLSSFRLIADAPWLHKLVYSRYRGDCTEYSVVPGALVSVFVLGLIF